jgi:uncharacterized membrane protein YgdD (TMEM256/DUF423 family)
MSRQWLVTGAIFGAISVALGAFGAHGLRTQIAPQALTTYETAIWYFQVHTLALLATAIVLDRWPGRGALVWAVRGFAAGCVFFSGSLMVLAVTGWMWLGFLTPIGGVLWIAAWIALAIGCARRA